MDFMSDTKDSPNASEKVEEKLTVSKQKERIQLMTAAQDFSDTTSRVVQQAANIMESEIAAGIAAFKKTEKQFVNTERFRYEKPDEVMGRFRRDAHEVIDIFIDVVDASLRNMEKVTSTVIVRGPNAFSKTEKATPIVKQSTISSQHPLKAGEKGEIPISLENSSDTQTDEFKLYSTELLSDTGMRVPSSVIKFSPSSLKIDPHKTETITVSIDLPKDTKPGTYCGLVMATNLNQLRSEIMIKVE
jgi:hypothetical protein